MKPKGIIGWLHVKDVRNPVGVLRHLANSVIDAQLTDGRRVLDASDFKEWLNELANEAAKELV